MIKIFKLSIFIFFTSFIAVVLESCKEIQAQSNMICADNYKETKDSLVVLKEQLNNKTEKIKKNNIHIEEKIISFDIKIKKINNP